MIRCDKPLLTEEEERSLGERARAGDIEARNELIERNVRLVAFAIRKAGLECEDRGWSWGYFGLVRSAGSYDPTKGRFSTHATKALYHFVRRYREEASPVRTPRYLETKYPVRPVYREAADRIHEARWLSLNFHQGSGDLVVDHGDTAWTEEDLRPRLHEILAELPDRERKVLTMRYGLDGNRPRTLRFVGHFFGISHEAVRRIEERAIQRARAMAATT